VDEDSPVFFFGLFDEADDCIDDVGVDDMLYVVFGPVEGEEAHALDSGVVGTVPACTVDNMGDLIECEPLDVLLRLCSTCAITSSPMKMESVILTGIDISSCPWLVSFCCMCLISDCYIIKLSQTNKILILIRTDISSRIILEDLV
jgi:hypothetical protein